MHKVNILRYKHYQILTNKKRKDLNTLNSINI